MNGYGLDWDDRSTKCCIWDVLREYINFQNANY